MDIFQNLPPLLQTEVKHFWESYLSHATFIERNNLLQQSQILDSLPKVWGCSPFVAKLCVQKPALLDELLPDLLIPPDSYPQRLATFLLPASDLMQVLRHFRQREMLRIAWRDLAGWAPLEETLAALSNLADALLQAALSQLYQSLTTQLGTPCNSKGIPQSLVILAMGKLGGQELNFSSDIDLIFAYPEAGETVGNKRPRTNQEFFTRLGQQLIQTLSQVTCDGFVFRVDMRLRPFGESGPLVINFTAMEEYYQAYARDWERYAMVKARVAAGDPLAGQSLLQMLRPFVYRRYLDFNAFEALRNMKTLIDQETSRKNLNHNIKLGPGGIREIEFTCQVFQLVRGGRQPALQQRNLLNTLQQIEKYQLLSPVATRQLREAYYFLRAVENHLQAMEDQQTQNLPAEPLNQMRLAYGLGFPDWNTLVAHLIHHQQNVHDEFNQVIAAPPREEQTYSSSFKRWQTLWLHDLQKAPEACARLSAAGFQEAPQVLKHLRQLVDSVTPKLSQRGQERLNTLIPLLISATLETSHPDEAISRTLRLVETIARRSVYLALLIERPQVLKQLVLLCAQSAWIAEQITRYPLLLDELIDPRRLYEPLQPEDLEEALNAQLAHLDDLEMQMDALRQFKRAQFLRVATAEVSGTLTLEVISDHLTAIADTLVNQTLKLAWNYLVQKYGQPYCNAEDAERTAGFCIIAYGKAGGLELSYGSDLDLVFLHDSDGTQQFTKGAKPLSNNVFFARLAQRIIHILTTNTPAGVLYEVDQRLRPSGLSGLLVSSLDTYETYQATEAWTWEHQALVRARAMGGDPHCIEKFRKIRHHILSLPRHPEQLKKEVQEMRLKMRDNLDKSTETEFDLKQGAGGLTDIEFIIQYQVLCWASRYPELLATTAMLRLLKLLNQYYLVDEIAYLQLREAYRAYRVEMHRLALQNQPALVEAAKFTSHRQEVLKWWQTFMQE